MSDPAKDAVDTYLKSVGGEIIPEEWKQTQETPKPTPAREPSFYSTPTGKLVKNEVEIFDTCLLAVKDFVAFRMKADGPIHVEDFNQWESGKRSPLEMNEPAIALEVYRQVREEMRMSSLKGGV